jgi:hypothetical protein
MNFGGLLNIDGVINIFNFVFSMIDDQFQYSKTHLCQIINTEFQIYIRITLTIYFGLQSW